MNFTDSLMEWHREHARSFPWRGERDPYKILVSEFMLQQTRTETVLRYYGAFLRAFPTAEALSGAPLEAVYKQWEGLGYYSRARNLQRAAGMIAGEYGGVVPSSFEELKKLPGVGSYIAGAVASIAYGVPVPALDGNQARVLTRVFGIRRPLASPAELFDLALSLIDSSDPGEYNQALMGLGATLCSPRHPDCERCPVAELCDARRVGDAESLPIRPERAEKKILRIGLAIAERDGLYLVRRRPDRGMLAGLFEFPCFEGAVSSEDVLECLREMGVRARFAGEAGETEHVFTHRVWKIRGYRFAVESADENLRFVTKEELAALAMSSAMKRYREAIR